MEVELEVGGIEAVVAACHLVVNVVVASLGSPRDPLSKKLSLNGTLHLVLVSQHGVWATGLTASCRGLRRIT